MLGIDTPESTTKLNFFGIEASQNSKKNFTPEKKFYSTQKTEKMTSINLEECCAM